MILERDLRTKLLDEAAELLGEAGRTGCVPVLGESMVPTLLPGQMLAVEFAVRSLRVGDLLVFRRNKDLVVHCYLGRARTREGRPCLRTRGDGKNDLDPPLDPPDVVGRVIAVRRGESWRGMRGRAARAYAAALALHDLCWAALGVVVERTLDRALRRTSRSISLRGRLAALDRWVLVRADRLLFDRVHARIAPPPGASGEKESTASLPSPRA